MTSLAGRTRGILSQPKLSLTCVSLALILILAAAIVWPAVVVIIDLTRGLTQSGDDASHPFFGPDTLPMLARTVAAAAIISGFSVIVAYPAAWAMRSHRALVPFMLIPLLLPSYVAYAALGTLRNPGTWLGDFLSSGATDSIERKVRIAQDIQAMLGLSIWAWPIAAIVISLSLRRLSPDVLDTLHIEPTSVWRQRRELVRLSRPAIIWAFSIVFVLMLGSAVPFHIAQLETYAIAIWRLIDVTAPPDRWRVWIAAIPLAAVTTGTGFILARKWCTIPDQSLQPPPSRPHTRSLAKNRTLLAWIGAAWITSVLVPAALLFAALHSQSAIPTFFQEQSGKLVDTFATAIGVALIGFFIAVSVWYLAARSRGSARLASFSTILTLFVAPLPGLLIGLAISRAWNSSPVTRPLADTSFIVILAHIARFAFIPVLVGWWLARSESLVLADIRKVDGADSLAAWFRACFLANAWPAVAAAAALAMLSIQEIEASIMVVPPGYDSLAEWMLQQLHFLREDQLAAGALFMLMPTFALASIAAWCLTRAHGRKNSHLVRS